MPVGNRDRLEPQTADLERIVVDEMDIELRHRAAAFLIVESILKNAFNGPEGGA